MLDSQAKALVELIASKNIPGPEQVTPDEARELYKKSRDRLQPVKPEVGSVSDFVLGQGNASFIVRQYRPLGADDQTVLPALIYFHGGGWLMGDIDTHDTLCRQLANFSGVMVFSVNYRKAPEHPFPAAVGDAIIATTDILEHAAQRGIDPKKIAVGGDSAGANLATVVAHTLRGKTGLSLACQLLIYPATDMHFNTESIYRYATGYLLTAAAMRYFREQYLPDEQAISDPRASPLLLDDLSHLPPALVLTAGFDPLRDEGRAYADALSVAGNRVQYICFERQIHGFIGMGGIIDEANTAVRLCADYLREQLQSSSPTCNTV